MLRTRGNFRLIFTKGCELIADKTAWRRVAEQVFQCEACQYPAGNNALMMVMPEYNLPRELESEQQGLALMYSLLDPTEHPIAHLIWPGPVRYWAFL